MSRSILSPFRTLLRSTPASTSSSSSSSTVSHYSLNPQSQSSPFSTSSPLSISKSKLTAKRKRQANLTLKAQRQSVESLGRVDPVLGYVIKNQTRSSNLSTGLLSNTTPWEGCRLQKTIITPEEVWSSPSFTTTTTTRTNKSESGSEVEPEPEPEPKYYLPGLSPTDQKLLFGALPESITSILHSDLTIHPKNNSNTETMEIDPRSIDAASKEISNQEKQVELMKRILDLRNANRQGIEVVNRERIVREFGGGQSGSSEVQAALLTQKIRCLNQHLSEHPRDIHNRRPLRQLVHQRASILKYIKRRQPAEYDRILKDLGLEARAVEGEIIL